MWKTKVFKTEKLAREWVGKNRHLYQCDIVFGHNCMHVQYRKLRRVG
jgi:hypothetical protein